MKNFFKSVGILTLLVFGFFYSEKTMTVMQDMDDIMIKIKEVSDKYEEKAVEATIKENGIIPGVAGKKIDVGKSYANMKRVNQYNSVLIEYKEVLPKIRLEKKYNYYILQGNPIKNMTSILLLVDKNTSTKDIKTIMNIASHKKVKLNFFIDGYFFEENNDYVTEIVSKGHELGNLSYNGDYKDSSFIWMDTIMKKVTNKKFSYCYCKEEREEYLDICKMYKNYTIKPTLVIENMPLTIIKKDVAPGDFISMKINEEVIQELPSILSYLNSKGIKVVTLTEHIKENK